MIGYYAECAPDGRYVQCIALELPSMEPPAPGDPLNTLHPVDAPPASWHGSTATEVLHLVDGVGQWVETATLADLQACAIIEIDRIADAARIAVAGDGARIKEYERAQQQAETFRDSGYALPAPSSVASWAVAKEWTDQAACDDILAAAERWLQALDGIRALRLKAKEDARRATDAAQTASIVATFEATLTAAMQGVA